MRKSVVILIVLIVAAAAASLWFAAEEGTFRGLALGSGAKAVHKSTSGNICVVQYVSHPLLDAVYAGFGQELEQQRWTGEIAFDNANGDATAASLLADKICKQSCAVILALATPMAQSVKSACPETQPILFGAVTDPMSAGLVTSMDAPGGNITGTSDRWPYELQMALTAHIWGSNASIGVPFNPAEANTQYAMEQIRRIAKDIGLTLHEVPINSVKEASQAVDALAGKVVAIYVPADNTAVAAAPGIVAAADRRNLPVVAGDPGTFKAGAVVGLGVDYKNLGILNAGQALSILSGSSPANIPVQISDRPELDVNAERSARFGINGASVRTWYADATSGSSQKRR